MRIGALSQGNPSVDPMVPYQKYNFLKMVLEEINLFSIRIDTLYSEI